MVRFKTIISFLLILAVSFSLFACGGASGNDEWDSDKEYTIQYNDDDGLHTISVKNGELYSMTSIPSKTGYEFLGLFDAEVGGTQYVNASGSALSVFTDGKNIVLYPQFKAKEYTLVLDYQGAAVTGVRSMQVEYDSTVNNLPMNLTMENKNFVGWFTEPNKGGEQVFDEYGAIPMKNIVNDEIFEITDSTKTLYLYAGFKGEEFTVTFYYDGISTPEEVKVEYGTYIADVQTETRVDGKGVLYWSTTRNDTEKKNIFTGQITGAKVLYSAEFAPVIDFETNGGGKVNSIIQRAGETVNLPIPVKKNYNFGGWKTESGTSYTATKMPSASIKLYAEWQAIITFNTNGGSAVAEISQKAGTNITLPETEKDGYMFAGWYEANGNKYENTSMPAASIKLNAKYYKTIKTNIVIIEASKTYGAYNTPTTPTIGNASHYIDLSTIYNLGVRQILVNAYYKVSYQWNGDYLATNPNICYASMSYYSNAVASSSYEMWSYQDEFNKNDTKIKEMVRSKKLTLTSENIYICRYQSYGVSWGRETHANWTDFYLEIEYPDMSKLY